MRNNCSKIRIVALVIFMLIGTMNMWAAKVDFTPNLFTGYNRNNVERNLNTVINAYDVVVGDGSVNKDVYMDLANYNGLRIKGTAGKKVRLLLNYHTSAEKEIIETINSHGVLEIDFNDHPDIKDMTVRHLNCIKIPNGESGVTITEVSLFDRNYFFDGKNVQARQVYSMSYRVPNNSQREFTFKQSRKWSEGAIRKYNWAMSVFDHILEGGGCRELLYMDCSCIASEI